MACRCIRLALLALLPLWPAWSLHAEPAGSKETVIDMSKSGVEHIINKMHQRKAEYKAHKERIAAEKLKKKIKTKQINFIHGKMDLDGDGKASLKEVMLFAEDMRSQMAEKEMKDVFPKLDLDKDGKLSLEELSQDHNETSEQEHESAKFRIADKNGDGHLDVEELPALSPHVHEGVLELACQRAVRRKDSDGDKELTLEEFWEASEENITKDEREDFRKLDSDESGTLSLEELRLWESGSWQALKAASKLLMLSDADGDMHVTAEEMKFSQDQIRGEYGPHSARLLDHLLDWVRHHESLESEASKQEL